LLVVNAALTLKVELSECFICAHFISLQYLIFKYRASQGPARAVLPPWLAIGEMGCPRGDLPPYNPRFFYQIIIQLPPEIKEGKIMLPGAQTFCKQIPPSHSSVFQEVG